ncbi:MAG TPA: methyltransferase domain-containing protein [Candidatus Kapabacteria bacterium]|nr:methyltransferase domain-containing protein [Candidatus Kapabacteria bacterium]
MEISSTYPIAASVRSDFDRIAAAGEERWDNNRHYHSYLLRQLKGRCSSALDVGCGSGVFTRVLAARAQQVTGIDLSPEMIRQAEAASTTSANVRYCVADVMTLQLPASGAGCVASIATLHHLPLREGLARMSAAVAPGGMLLILDLYRSETMMERLAGVPAACMSMLLRLLHTGRLRPPRAVSLAWQAHACHDRYPTLAEIRSICAGVLPGARVRRHLLWRYSIVWSAPADVS